MQGSTKKELPGAAEKLYEALLRDGDGRPYRLSAVRLYRVADLEAGLLRGRTRDAVQILDRDGYLVRPPSGDFWIFRPAPWDRVETEQEEEEVKA